MILKFDPAHPPRLYPNSAEEDFLNRAYPAFYDAKDRLESDTDLSAEQRLASVTQILALYTELLAYKPIQLFVDEINRSRPPGEATAYQYFEMIRHILVHFPFYKTWSDVVFDRTLITWQGRHKKIDNFMCRMDGHEPYKWRIWDHTTKTMTYGYELRFPQTYKAGGDIYLQDLVSEDEGIQFCLLLIDRAFKSQVV
jgi:hypothetical protein